MWVFCVPNTFKTAGASGIETDLDDPTDNVVHEDEELANTGLPCKPGEQGACRERRQVSVIKHAF